MSWLTLETVGFFATILFLLYYYSTSRLRYWEKRGVKGPKPIPFLGNFKDVFLVKSSVNDCFVNAYYEFKDEPMVGVFDGHIPHLIVKDPDLIKDILIKDFPKFVERVIVPNEVEPLSEHLFTLEAKRWKPVRARLTPVFTSGKLKEMFPLLLECGNQLEEHLFKLVEKGEYIACREISVKFATDIMGSYTFGMEMNELAADSEFRKICKQIFNKNLKSVLRDRLRSYPFLFKILGPYIVHHEITDFFIRITKECIDYRIEHNFHRNDFIDILVEMKKNPEKIIDKELTDSFFAALAFSFFAGGFETSSLMITHVLYELALNQSIQENLRKEINDILQRSNGEITYNNIKEMKYLDAVLQETLRKRPVALWLSRVAMTNYTFTDTKVTIPKGQHIVIPLYAIQNDPDIFPQPEVFDPNRFLDGNAKVRHPMFYLPFGNGPRNCIGGRFAKILSKVAMIKILSNFKVDVCEKTVKYNKNPKPMFLLQPRHEIYLKITKV